MNSFRPEVCLLLDCARSYLDAQGAKRIKSLIAKDIDWTYLLRIARAHSVMPLLYRTLNSTCSNTVPTEILEELREHFYANAGRNLFLAKELLKLLQLFEAREIPAVPYKGPTLTACVYGNLALREFGDLDILVREREYQSAQHLLIGQGYQLTKQFDCESTLVHDSGTFAVDLHKGMTAREFPCPLSFEYLSVRLQRITVAGAEIPTLSPEDTLIMLAIQITKDAGSRYLQLAKICDIAELLRAYPRLDLVHAVKQAKRLGGERMLLFSLRLTNDLLGLAVPQAVECDRLFRSSIDEFVEHAVQQLFQRSTETSGDELRTQQFQWLMRERFRDKLLPYYFLYVRDVIVPCELDRQVLYLSRRLSFFYYFIRPARLICKYAALLFKARNTQKAALS
jgi:hypothetical protein